MIFCCTLSVTDMRASLGQEREISLQMQLRMLVSVSLWHELFTRKQSFSILTIICWWLGLSAPEGGSQSDDIAQLTNGMHLIFGRCTETDVMNWWNYSNYDQIPIM